MVSTRCVSHRPGMPMPLSATPLGKTVVWAGHGCRCFMPARRGSAALWMVADWLAGWAGEDSYDGPVLLLTIAPSPWPAGMVGFVCQGAGTIGLVPGVAPSCRGQGLATRAVLLAAGWLIRERGAEVGVSNSSTVAHPRPRPYRGPRSSGCCSAATSRCARRCAARILD